MKVFDLGVDGRALWRRPSVPRHCGHLMPVLTGELDSSGVPRLKRVLTVWDLAFYGVVAVTPSAPATVFGLAQLKSHGHAVDTLLVAMVAMVLTAISYGRMAALYPSAGSAYTYVGPRPASVFGLRSRVGDAA